MKPTAKLPIIKPSYISANEEQMSPISLNTGSKPSYADAKQTNCHLLAIKAMFMILLKHFRQALRWHHKLAQ